MANGNGFKINLVVVLFAISLMIGAIMYTVARTENSITRINGIEKRMDRFEDNQGQMLIYFGMRPAEK